MQEKQFAFIPWWIASVLTRNSLKAEDLLSFERIRPFFSTEDLTSLMATNYLVRFFVGNGIGSDTVQWCDRWLASAGDARNQNLIRDIACLANSNQTQDEILKRLVTEPSPATGIIVGSNAAQDSAGPSETFEVSMMGDQGVAVYLKKGFTLMDHNRNSFKLLRSMVKQLYVYEDYPQLVSRPVGLAYVESLMH